MISNPYKSIIVVAIKRDWHRTLKTGNNAMVGGEDLMKKIFTPIIFPLTV